LTQNKNKWTKETAIRALSERGDRVNNIEDTLTVESSKKLGIYLLGAVDFLKKNRVLVVRK